jgi:hypothetical protein
MRIAIRVGVAVVSGLLSFIAAGQGTREVHIAPPIISTSDLSSDPTVNGPVRFRAAATMPREEPPLYVATELRARGTKIQVVVLQGQSVVARELLVLDEAVRDGGVVLDILADHPLVLRRVRELEGANPLSVRLRITSDGAPDLERTLAELETRSRKMNAARGITSRTSLTISLRGPRVATDGNDPECNQQCSDAREFCYTDICDPRGSCYFCEVQYNDCVNTCPDACTEPKDVYEVYGPWNYYGSSYLGTSCFENANIYDNVGHLYDAWQNTYRRNVYERTEHCDGTYTDTFVGVEYGHSYCYSFVAANACVAPQPIVNPPIC